MFSGTKFIKKTGENTYSEVIFEVFVNYRDLIIVKGHNKNL